MLPLTLLAVRSWVTHLGWLSFHSRSLRQTQGQKSACQEEWLGKVWPVLSPQQVPEVIVVSIIVTLFTGEGYSSTPKEAGPVHPEQWRRHRLGLQGCMHVLTLD